MLLFLLMSKRGVNVFSKGVWCLDYHPLGETIASASSSGFCKLWDPKTKAPAQKLNAHKGFAYWVKFNSTG